MTTKAIKAKPVIARDAKPETILLNGSEVAEVLGVSRSLAYRWMQAGTLPVVRISGSKIVRVPLAALNTWVDRNTQTPA